MIGVETDVSGRLGQSHRLAGSGPQRGPRRDRAQPPSRPHRDSEVSVKFTSDEEVRALNAAWRGKDKATNVLSFPMADESELAGAQLLGDIVLAHGICAAEAADEEVAIETHAAHLVVHGTLHLLGYDHETSDADAEEMEEVERARARLDRHRRSLSRDEVQS